MQADNVQTPSPLPLFDNSSPINEYRREVISEII